MTRLDESLQRLMRDRRRLDDTQGRIARKNARRAFIGAMRSVRLMLDAEYPAIAKPVVPSDPITNAAATMRWREFEYRVITHVRLDWDLVLAEQFNQRCAAALGCSPKPIVIDSGIGRYMGLHDTNAIRLAAGMSREDKWRTLMHEIAHYPPHRPMHGRAFVRTLAHVYRLWREFRELGRVAAKEGK